MLALMCDDGEGGLIYTFMDLQDKKTLSILGSQAFSGFVHVS